MKNFLKLVHSLYKIISSILKPYSQTMISCLYICLESKINDPSLDVLRTFSKNMLHIHTYFYIYIHTQNHIIPSWCRKMIILYVLNILRLVYRRVKSQDFYTHNISEHMLVDRMINFQTNCLAPMIVFLLFCSYFFVNNPA